MSFKEMMAMEDALKIAAEAVKIHRDSNCSIEDAVNSARKIYEEVRQIEVDKKKLVI